MSYSPLLPPELEYDIFMIAYQNDHSEAKNLVLVARRVFDWLIPLIFRVVKLSEQRYAPIKFNESAYKQHGHHTRHLFHESDILGGKHLHLFPNVINIALWVNHTPSDIPILLQLPLKCISARASLDLFQVFANVTHLDLTTGLPTDMAAVEEVLYFPKLTHLCVLNILDATEIEVFLDMERCPKLRVVVLWGNKDAHGGAEGTTERVKVDDERAVRVRCHPAEDWEMGARGGMDMWKVAERLVEERRDVEFARGPISDIEL